MKYSILKNSSGVILPIYISDLTSVVGGGLTGVYPGYSGLTAYYKRTTDSSITKFNLANGTIGSYVASGLIEINPTFAPGDYELSLPANATVVPSGNPVFLTVSLIGGTNMLPCKIDIQLNDPISSVGGTAYTPQPIAEPSTIPTFPCTSEQMLAFMFQRSALQESCTATEAKVYKSDNVTVVGTAPITDDGTTLVRGKFS